MRRQSDDFSKTQLPDVREESDVEVYFERWSRSSMTPDSGINSFRSETNDRKISTASNSSDGYWEATGRRRSEDQGVILTSDTDNFIIGQRVWVGGIRSGQIAYIGETHFAPGDWAGIVLDETTGKNDGSLGGKRYFQCEAKKGIFSRLTRLTREPMPGASNCDLSMMDHSMRSMSSPLRSGNVSPTHSVQSYASRTPTGKAASLQVGDRVIVSSGFGSRPGILRFLGETKFAAGTWCGIQLDEASGKNDGTVDGYKYFECPDKYGIFVPIAKVTLSPSSRKSRLSRANSKESLTSVGTMNSLATTNTSRLRMSAQRSSTAKPVATTPKTSFSLQDVLREKQNHIEQLMNEREIEREETANSAIMYQKNVQQLKEKISSLEHKLSEEKRKTEDLQFSVDEATFCGEELNVQTQIFKEKIAKLETELSEKSSETSIAEPNLISSVDNGKLAELAIEIEKFRSEAQQKDQKLNLVEELKKSLENEVQSLHERLAETEKSLDIKTSSCNVSEQCLKQEIEYLKDRIEELEVDITGKEAEREKNFIDLKHVEGKLDTEVSTLQDEIKFRDMKIEELEAHLKKESNAIIHLRQEILVRDEKRANGDSEIQSVIKAKDEEYGKLKADYDELKNLMEGNRIFENEEEKEIMKLQRKAATDAQAIVNLSKEIEHLKQKLLLSQGNLHVKESLLEEKDQAIGKIKDDLKGISSEIEKKVHEISDKDNKIKSLELKLHNSEDSSMQLQIEMQMLKSELETINRSKDALESEVKNLNQTELKMLNKLSTLETDILGKDKQLEDNETMINALQSELKELNSTKGNLIKELEDFKLNMADTNGAFKQMNEENTKLMTELSNIKQSMEDAQKAHEDMMMSSQILMTKSFADERDNFEKVKIEVIQQKESFINELKAQLSNSMTDAEGLRGRLDAEIAKHLESEKDGDVKMSEIKEKNKEIEALKSELVKTDENLDKITKINAENLEKYETSEKRLAETQENLSKLEVSHADLLRKIEILDQKLSQVSQVRDNLEKDIDTLRSTTLDSNEELKRYSELLKVKEREHNELQDSSNGVKMDFERRLHEASQVNQNLNATIETIRQEMQNMAIQKIDRENELNVELAKIKECAENEKENLVREIEGLKRSFLDEKEKLSTEISIKASEYDQLAVNLKDVTSSFEIKVKNLEEELENQKKVYNENVIEWENKLKEQLIKTEELNNAIGRLNKEKAAIEDNLENLQKSSESGANELLTQLNDKAAKISYLEENLRESRDELQKKHAEIGEMRNKLEDNVKSHSEILKQMEDYLNQIQNLSAENKRVDLMYKEQCEKVKDISGKFKNMEEEQIDLVHKKQCLKVEIGEARDKIAFLESEQVENLAIIKMRDEELANIRAAVENANESSKDEIEKLSSIINDKDKEIKELSEKASQVENLTDDLKNAMNSKSEALRKKDEKIALIAKDFEELSRKISEKDFMIREKDFAIENLTKQLNETAEKLENTKEKLLSTEKCLKESNNELADCNIDYNAMKGDYEKTKADNKGHEEKIKENAKKINELETKLAAQTKEFEELINKKKSIETESSRKIHEMNQDILKIESLKKTEIDDLLKKLENVQTKVEQKSMESVRATDSLRNFERKKQEFECQRKELELKETEMEISSRKMSKEIEYLKLLGASKESEIEKLKNELKSHAKITTSPILSSNGDTEAQINFLNSIIADMQKKNETLMLRIETLENTGYEMTKKRLDYSFEKRKPAPRLFCDICDEFDLHDTEDCPKQSSETPPESMLYGMDKDKKRSPPPPRKYCEGCEVFGHEFGECPDDTY